MAVALMKGAAPVAPEVSRYATAGLRDKTRLNGAYAIANQNIRKSAMTLRSLVWIPLAMLLAGCGESTSQRATREGSQSAKLTSPEQQQFLVLLTSFHSAVSSLASAYDAAHKADALGRGLQDGSASVVNMKGSDFIRQAEALSSAVDQIPELKEQARFALSALADNYATLQEKFPKVPQIDHFFSLPNESGVEWVDREQTVRTVQESSHSMLRELSNPSAWTHAQRTQASEPRREASEDPGHFAALSAGSTAVSLADAKWSKHVTEPGVELHSVAWSGKAYVAVGLRGVILRSEDLQRWERVQSGGDDCLNTVVWLGSRFVVGGWGVILTSVDGKSWTRSYANTNCSFFERGNETGPPPGDGYRVSIEGFASNGKLLLAAGSGGAMLTSTSNGDTWSVAARKPPLHLYHIAWSGNRFVGFGAVDSGTWLLPLEDAILTSTDGVKWATKPDSHNVQAIVWTGSEFAAVNTKGHLLLSKDGSKWLRRKLPVDYAGDIAWTGREYVIGCGDVILTGSDGVNWKLHCPGIAESMIDSTKLSWTGNKLLVTASGDCIFEATP